MLIWRFRPKGADADPGLRNFGDELGTWLWPKLIENEAAFAAIPGIFYGVGTVLGQKCPQDAPKHVVFGAGLGYNGVPKIDERWRIYFVRGPHTAQQLGAATRMVNDAPVRSWIPWITDPGLLVHRFFVNGVRRIHDRICGFMPRWDSVSEELRDGCSRAGILLIDPRWPVETVIETIQGCDLLLTEALHGAVVADALRVPWISIYANRGHEFKWRDFCASLGMIWNPIDMADPRFSLSWARDFAVPQLSAQSVLDDRKRKLDEAVKQLNTDIEKGNL